MQPDRAGAHRAEAMYTLKSRDLRMWVSMISSRIFSFQKVMVTSRQVLLLASLQSSISQKRIAGLNVKTKHHVVVLALGKE